MFILNNLYSNKVNFSCFYKKLKFNIKMRNMEFTPYKFFFLSETPFKNLKDSLLKGNYETKISTIGQLTDYNPQNSECLLNYDNETLKINFERIKTNFIFNATNYFYVYGILKASFNLVFKFNF